MGLYADDKHSTRLVAFEKVYEGVSIIHHVRLTNDLVKVGLEEVQDVNADILLPTSRGSVSETGCRFLHCKAETSYEPCFT